MQEIRIGVSDEQEGHQCVSIIAVCILLMICSSGCVRSVAPLPPSGMKAQADIIGTWTRCADGSSEILHIFPQGSDHILVIYIEDIPLDKAPQEANVKMYLLEGTVLRRPDNIYFASLRLRDLEEEDDNAKKPFYLFGCRINKDGKLEVVTLKTALFEKAIATGKLKGIVSEDPIANLSDFKLVLSSSSADVAEFLLHINDADVFDNVDVFNKVKDCPYPEVPPNW